MTPLEQARAAHEAAVERLSLANQRIQALPDTSSRAEQNACRLERERALLAVDSTREQHERQVAIRNARQLIPPAQDGNGRGDGFRVTVGQEEPVYRPDVPALSFFRDVVHSRQDPEAQERLRRHQTATLDRLAEKRDVTTGDPGGAGFVPPIYLGEQWAELPRASRPFAEIVPKLPLPDVGTVVTVPKVQSGTTVAVQATEAAALSETDIDTQTVTSNLVTIAGMNDLTLQVLERTFPGLDQIIFQDLMADYDEQLDTQLLQGTAASGQHRGLSAVSGTNSVTYTDANPTGAELLPKIYNAIERVASLRFRNPDTIVMHPRRAAWLGKELSATFPLFHQGQLPTSQIGEQQGGFVQSFGGLRVLLDANITTELGASTDEDIIWVLHLPDLVLMEGPVQFVRFDDVLSGTLQVRLRLHGFSFWIPHRQPTAISKVSGTGLRAPTFA